MSDVDVKLGLTKDEFERELQKVHNQLWAASETYRKSREKADNFAFVNVKRRRADALTDQEKKKRQRQKHIKTWEKDEKRLSDLRERNQKRRIEGETNFVKLQERIQRRVQRAGGGGGFDPAQAASTAGAAALAAGGTIGQAIGLGGVVHVLSAITNKIGAVRSLTASRKQYNAAVAAGDKEAAQEAGSDLVSNTAQSAAATRNIAITAAVAAATVGIRMGQQGYKNETLERTLFQASGLGRTGMLQGGLGRYERFGMNAEEAIQTATQLSTTGVVTDNAQLRTGDTDPLGMMMKMRMAYGDSTAGAASSLLTAGVRGGAITGEGEGRNKLAVDLLSKAIGVQVTTGLERSRINEALQSMAQMQQMTPGGMPFNAEAAAQILAAVGQQGAQFRGAGGMPVADLVTKMQTGKAGDISRAIRMQMAFASGNVTDPLSLEEEMSSQDPMKMRDQLLKMGMGDKQTRRNYAYAIAQQSGSTGMEAMTALNAMLDMKAAPAGKPEEVPDNLKTILEMVNKWTDFQVRGGEAARDMAPSVKKFADAVDNFGGDVAIMTGALTGKEKISPVNAVAGGAAETAATLAEKSGNYGTELMLRYLERLILQHGTVKVDVHQDPGTQHTTRVGVSNGGVATPRGVTPGSAR